jgi:hypothetical protein
MVCHYCHSKDHSINQCPTIICRYCKQVGHPKWLCKSKNKVNDKPNEKYVEKDITYYLKIKDKKWSEMLLL